MVNDVLLKYVRQMRANGVSDDDLKKSLSEQGWSESDILAALWYDLNKAKEEEQEKKVKKKKRSLFRLASMVVILGMLWFAGMLYARIWDPPWNPFPEPPLQLIEKLPF